MYKRQISGTSLAQRVCAKDTGIETSASQMVMYTVLDQYLGPVGNLTLGTLMCCLALFVWVLMFVALFELWLSILAELTRFGDRQFYKDWWNAQKFDEYWRLWNLPVHNWLVRHVFFPCLNLGLNKMAATLVVFFVSAALHEVLVSGPCHVARLYAFAGMMGQVPLIALTNALHGRLPSNRLGNVLFWVVFCVVGQPMALMLYFHDTVQSSSASAKGSFGGEL